MKNDVIKALQQIGVFPSSLINFSTFNKINGF
jgi:hypothetical protein